MSFVVVFLLCFEGSAIGLMNNPRTVFQSSEKKVYHDCTAGFLLQDFFFFPLYSEKLFPCTISLLPPYREPGSGAAFHEQFNMDCSSVNLANILFFYSVENLHVPYISPVIPSD